MLKNGSFFFLFSITLLLFSLPTVNTTVVNNLDLTVVNSPTTLNKDLNFSATWQGAGESGLELWWQLDSNTFIQDLSDNNRAASNISNVDLNTDTFQRGLGSLHFNDLATSNVQLNDFNFPVQQAFTMSIWVYPDTNNQDMMAFWNGDSSGNGYGGDSEVHLGTGMGGTNDQFEFYIDGIGNDCQAIDPSTYASGQWHHLVGTYDGGTSCELFVNGVSVDTDITTLPDMNGFSGLTYLGRPGSTSSSRFWEGNLDDARLWSTRLSDSDINGLFNAEDPSGNYWQFNADGNVNNFSQDPDFLINQNFNAGTFADWDIRSGTWSAASNALVNTTAGNGKISIDFNRTLSDSDLRWNFVINTPLVNPAFVAVASNGSTFNLNTDKGYFFEVNTAGLPSLNYFGGEGTSTVLISGPSGDITASTDANITITRSSIGNWNLIVDQNFLGSDLNTSVVDANFFWLEFRDQDQSIDDVEVFVSGPGPLLTPQFQSHTFTTPGVKTIIFTAQNADGNVTATLDINITGSLDITVFDENKLFPINGAIIDFNSGTYTTDTLGQISIPLADLTPGQFEITIDVNSQYTQRKFNLDLNQFSSDDVNFLMLQNTDGTLRDYKIFQPDETTPITNSFVEWQRTDGIPNGVAQKTKTSATGTVSFFGQQDANYTLQITDLVSDINRTYTGTLLTIKIPLDAEDLVTTLTPYSVTVGGLASQSFTNLTSDLTFRIFSDTVNFYNIGVDFNADYFPTNKLIQTKGGKATEEFQPYLILQAGNLASIIFTIDNINQKQTIQGIKIVSETIIGGTLTEVESKFSDITGTAEFHFIIGNDYVLSFFDSEGSLIFSGTLTAKSVDTTLFAALAQQVLFGTAEPTGNFNLSWSPIVSQINPVDGNITITNTINPFNTVVGDVNVFISHISDSNIIFQRIFTLDSSDQNQTITYDVNVSGFDDDVLLKINVQVFDVNGFQISNIQVKQYSFKVSRIIGAFESLKEDLGAFPVMFLAIVFSAAIVGLITLFSTNPDNNWVGPLALVGTAFFVIITWIPLEAWLVAASMSIGLTLWRDREQ